MKKSILPLIILFSGILMLIYGCTKDESNPDNGNNALIINEGEMIIKGTSDYEFSMTLEEASYLVTYKEKAPGSLKNFQCYSDFLSIWLDYMPYSIMALRESNWYEGSVIEESTSNYTWRFKVTASGEYQIEFHKIPLSKTAVNLPQNFSGAGATVFGPVAISGSASFTIDCSDAKQAGFVVSLFNASTGAELLSPEYKPLYVNLDSNDNGINVINTTITKSGLSGIYLIEVHANMFATYTLNIH
jgi:hypothetical protein